MTQNRILPDQNKIVHIDTRLKLFHIWNTSLDVVLMFEVLCTSLDREWITLTQACFFKNNF